MNKKYNFLILSFIASAAVFAYLTYHHYMVKLGLTGSTLCQISQKLNCDTAALSKYAEIFSIPIAVLGLSYSVIMLGVFLFAKLEWFEETSGYKTIMKLITGTSAALSIILFVISALQLKVYCPFCIIGYIISFVIAGLTWSLYKDTPLSLSEVFGEKSIIGTLIAIPVLAWFISGSIRDNFGLNEIEKIIPEKIYLWQNSPQVSFDNNLGLIKGSTESSAPVIIEFADFKCPHCKTASQALKTYVTSNQKVKMVFKPYPLDGVCNPHIPSKGDGTRCELAGWALCAERLFQKGWQAHYWIFDNQESLSHKTDLSDSLKSMANDVGINADEIKTCATSTETYEAIKALANEGNNAKISGTPTIFLNGKKLDGGQFIEILRSAVNSL